MFQIFTTLTDLKNRLYQVDNAELIIHNCFCSSDMC